MQKHTILLIAIILVYLINGIVTIPKLSITSDEGSHLDYGLRFIQGDPNRYLAEKDNSKMPINVLNTIPRVFEQLSNKNLHKADGGDGDVLNGRYVTLFFSVLSILLIFVWASDLYGKNAGVFAAFLFSWCPNNLAAATLTTTDAYATFFFTATLYCLYKWCKSSTVKNLVYFSIFIALSQLAKQSLFHLYPLCAMLIVGYAFYKKIKPNYTYITKSLLIFGAINFIILNAGFLFNKMFVPLGDYHFMSNMFTGLQNYLPSKLPVPFSKAFIDGLDMAKYYDQIGGGHTGTVESSFGNVTILNQTSTGGSFWYYYFVTIWYKTPISYFLMAIAAFVFSVKKKFNQRSNEIFFLLLPAVYFITIFSFLYNTQCGVRHIILLYPLLFIYSSKIINFVKSKLSIGLVILFSGWLVVTVVFYKGNYCAYTNEFITDKTFAYKKVGADNLFIKQSKFMLEDYLLNHKEVSYAATTPAAGIFAISVKDYLDVWNTGNYKWLSNKEPFDNIANGCYLLIRVTDENLNEIK